MNMRDYLQPGPQPGQIILKQPGDSITALPPMVAADRVVALWESFFGRTEGKLVELERRAFASSMLALSSPPMFMVKKKDED